MQQSGILDCDWGEWECLPGNALGEAMDAAGYAACVVADTAIADATTAATACATTAPPCLDLRHLAAPEPMQRALAAVDALPSGAALVLLTPLLPVPLLQVLEARGYVVDAQQCDDGSARVVVHVPSA